jgi:hypothetical protein
MARVCPKCNKAFASTAYAAHTRTCKTTKPAYECGACAETFPSFGKLVLHVRTCHPNNYD